MYKENVVPSKDRVPFSLVNEIKILSNRINRIEMLTLYCYNVFWDSILVS